MDAAFRHTENVGFQDHQYFGAYNLHFRCGLVSHPPSFTSSCYQTGCGGSVLRWWLAFPQVGFSPTGEYELCSAHLRFLHAPYSVAGSIKYLATSIRDERKKIRGDLVKIYKICKRCQDHICEFRAEKNSKFTP